jgi:hypothetical protein
MTKNTASAAGNRILHAFEIFVKDIHAPNNNCCFQKEWRVVLFVILELSRGRRDYEKNSVVICLC